MGSSSQTMRPGSGRYGGSLSKSSAPTGFWISSFARKRYQYESQTTVPPFLRAGAMWYSYCTVSVFMKNIARVSGRMFFTYSLG